MRSGWIGNKELQQHVMRADPDARMIVQAVVNSAEDLKDTRAEWLAMDSGVGFEILDEGGIRLLGATATQVDHGGNGTTDATDIRTTDLGLETPLEVAVVQ